MELGEKLRKARLEAGLSQRQLCGERITRNMLSQIENGTAKPSMQTLQYLARQLGKSVGYFLEEEGVVSSNGGVMEAARLCHARQDPAGVLEALSAYIPPDPVFDREMELLKTLAQLDLGEQALRQGRKIYARELLEAAETDGLCAGELERRRLLLLGQLGEPVSARLPSLDAELLLRAREALAGEQPDRAACLLDAAEDHQDPQWCLVRGEVYLRQRAYAAAVSCFHRAEAAFPDQTISRLEICYRELGDYQQAYRYAKLGQK